MPKTTITLDINNIHVPTNRWIYGAAKPLSDYEDDIRNSAYSGSIQEVIDAVKRYEGAEKRETKRMSHNSIISNVKKIILELTVIGDYITHTSVADALRSHWAGNFNFVEASISIVIRELVKEGKFETVPVDYCGGRHVIRKNAYKRIT